MTKNINIILKGGLGNQLFQYFTAYFLSKKLNMNLAVDVSNYKNNNYRQFKLFKLLRINKNYFKNNKENFFLRKFKKIHQFFFLITLKKIMHFLIVKLSKNFMIKKI